MTMMKAQTTSRPIQHCTLCAEENISDYDLEIIGDCVLCGSPTCAWHGKEYHAWRINGIAHTDCFTFGVDD